MDILGQQFHIFIGSYRRCVLRRKRAKCGNIVSVYINSEIHPGCSVTQNTGSKLREQPGCAPIEKSERKMDGWIGIRTGQLELHAKVAYLAQSRPDASATFDTGCTSPCLDLHPQKNPRTLQTGPSFFQSLSHDQQPDQSNLVTEENWRTAPWRSSSTSSL